MTWLDKFLQLQRINQVRPFLNQGDRVLDIGSSDGVMFDRLPFLGAGCLGIDPTLTEKQLMSNHTLIPGYFPDDMPQVEPFDSITLLAVIEHFPVDTLPALVEGCRQFVKKHGKVIITVPSPAVDYILALLKFAKLVHGMALEEHHGYNVATTEKLFNNKDFALIHFRKFQFGLNNLFVFQKF